MKRLSLLVFVASLLLASCGGGGHKATSKTATSTTSTTSTAAPDPATIRPSDGAPANTPPTAPLPAEVAAFARDTKLSGAALDRTVMQVRGACALDADSLRRLRGPMGTSPSGQLLDTGVKDLCPKRLADLR